MRTLSLLSPTVRAFSSFSSSAGLYTLRNPSNFIAEADTVKIWSAAWMRTEVVSYSAGLMRLATKRFQTS